MKIEKIQLSDELIEEIRELTNKIVKIFEPIIEAIVKIAKKISKLLYPIWKELLKMQNSKYYNMAFHHKKKRIREKYYKKLIGKLYG